MSRSDSPVEPTTSPSTKAGSTPCTVPPRPSCFTSHGGCWASDPPDYLATLLFVSIGFLAAVGIIVQLRVRFMPTLAVWAECSMIGAVGLATPAWWILTIGRGYESSIACGYALVMTGLAVLLSAMHDPDRPNRWMLALGAFCLAAAVGARPHLFVAGAYLVLTGYFIARSRRRAGATSGLGLDLVALTGPYLFVGALLGAYNLARFGSLTEFGTQYQLSYWNLRTYPLVKLSYLAPNLWDYLVALPLARCQVAILLPAGEHQHPGPGDPWAFPRGGCGCVAPLPGDSRRPHHLCRQRTQDVAKGQTARGTTWDSRSCWR